MIISFECVQCEADLEFEVMSLIKDPTQIECPNCGVKADAETVETAMTSLDELLTQFARLQRRFRVGFSLEPEELAEELAENYEIGDDEETFWSDETDLDDEE